MSYCPNCRARLTCSCQKTKCKDGSACCTNCVAAKNKQIVQTQQKKDVVSDGNIAPTNVQVSYVGPGKQL